MTYMKTNSGAFIIELQEKDLQLLHRALVDTTSEMEKKLALPFSSNAAWMAERIAYDQLSHLKAEVVELLLDQD